MNIFQWLSKWAARTRPTETYAITDDEIIYEVSDGTRKCIAWKDLTKISILTTDEGPFTDDYFYLFVGASSDYLLLPLAWSVKLNLLQFLWERYPTLDHE